MMGMKVNALLGQRLFRNSKGETLILQKGLRANDNRTTVSLFKLDGIDIIPVSEKIYGENHSAKNPDIYKHHKLNEQIVTRTKKGNNMIGTLYSYRTFFKGSIEFAETKNGAKVTSSYDKDKPVSMFQDFCEAFGAPGKRIYNKLVKGSKR